MSFKTITVFYTVFFLFIQFQQLRAQKKKDCQLSKFENDMNSIFGYFGYKDNKWPENDQEMNAWCKAVRRDKPLVKSYSLECLSGMSKTLASVIIYSFEKVTRLFCRNKKERLNYIAKGKCGNRAKKDTMKCWDDLTTIITNMKNLPGGKDKIPTLCCTFFWWKECTLGAYKRHAPICTEANEEHMEQHIDKAALDGLNVLCGDPEESDKCKKYNQKFDRTKVPSKYKTYFPALFELFETL